MGFEEEKTMSSKQVETSEPADVIQTEKVEALNLDLAKALEQSRPDPWSRGYIGLYCVCLLIYLCSTMNGALLRLRRRDSNHLLTVT